MSATTRIRTASRNAVAVLALTAAAVAGTAATTATSAAAAGGTANDVNACFNYAQGTAYGSKGAYLYRYADGGWQYTRRAAVTGPGGCVRFNDVASNQYFLVQAFWSYSPNGGASYYYYYGYSNYGWSGAARDTSIGLGRSSVYGPYCLAGC